MTKRIEFFGKRAARIKSSLQFIHNLQGRELYDHRIVYDKDKGPVLLCGYWEAVKEGYCGVMTIIDYLQLIRVTDGIE